MYNVNIFTLITNGILDFGVQVDPKVEISIFSQLSGRGLSDLFDLVILFRETLKHW